MEEFCLSLLEVNSNLPLLEGLHHRKQVSLTHNVDLMLRGGVGANHIK